jgi:hypothetical protein
MKAHRESHPLLEGLPLKNYTNFQGFIELKDKI